MTLASTRGLGRSLSLVICYVSAYCVPDPAFMDLDIIPFIHSTQMECLVGYRPSHHHLQVAQSAEGRVKRIPKYSSNSDV